MAKDFKTLLSGSDKRTVRGVNVVVQSVLKSPERFREVFQLINDSDPAIRMRASDAVEKITKTKPELLQKYKKLILTKISRIEQQEVRWHVAQIIPRLQLSNAEAEKVFVILNNYLRSTKSNIVRVMSLQALAEVALQEKIDIEKTLRGVEKYAELVKTPSVQARAQKIIKQLSRTMKS